jgi:Zn-dependent protease with chaperone function
MQWARTLLACACTCIASPARAAVLPADLAAKVDAHYEPVDADERAMWQKLALLEEAIRTSPQRLRAPELDAYTRGVVERLIGRAAPELRIYLMRDASFNAAMFPSGMMIVNTGVLVRVRSEAQLAAVLGHEVGHYFRKHSLDRHRDMRHKTALSAAAASAERAGTYDWAPGMGSWNLITQAIMESVFRFSQEQESEADAFALMLMARSGYAPRAASAMYEQLIDERRASAAARAKRYHAGAGAALSTHPPTRRRIIDLADTADSLTGKGERPGSENHDEWAATIRPYRGLLLQEQIDLNDPGASLYLLEHLAKDGWTGTLRFNEGEVYRLRDANGDDLKAAAAYAAAVALADAPPEAWRAHGYALLKTGDRLRARQALNRYLAMTPDAADAAMIRFVADDGRIAADEASLAGGGMSVEPDSPWKKVRAGAPRTRWEEVWTWSGPQIDRTTLIGGLPEGKSILSRQKNADRQVPVFRADMTAHDLASMVEVSYRVNGVTVFVIESVEPVDFVGGPGVGMRYHYASGLGISKRGRCVMRVVGRKLYAMRLESVANRDFEAVASWFELLVASAKLRR